MAAAPKLALWWGIALTVLGALIATFAPGAVISLVQAQGGDPQLLTGVIVIASSLITQLVLPLGCALIAAAVIMFYIDWRLNMSGPEDRPKRLLLR
jgi:hypothetical protein